MDLKSFQPATQEVAIPGGGTFAVRGLALEDFTILLRKYYEPMAALFDQYLSEAALAKVDKDTENALGLADMKGVILNALTVAPGLIGDTIARAADMTEDTHLPRLLPMGTQIDAMTKIVTLTLEAEGGVEKLIETVSTLATSLSTVAANRPR